MTVSIIGQRVVRYSTL